MAIRIRLVPNDQPNADGHWILVDMGMPKSRGCHARWTDTVEAVKEHIPEGFHVVSVMEDRA